MHVHSFTAQYYVHKQYQLYYVTLNSKTYTISVGHETISIVITEPPVFQGRSQLMLHNVCLDSVHCLIL